VSGAVAVAIALAAANPTAIVSRVARHVSHGFADNGLSTPQLEARIAGGHHVSVLCGQAAELTIRALQRAGIPARRVGTFTDHPTNLLDVPAGTLESHAMLEAWTAGHWALYDPDSNVQPVTAHGAAVTIERYARMRHRHYRRLAHDRLYDPRGDHWPRYEHWLFSHHEQWLDRVLGVVTIQDGDRYVYTGRRSGSMLAGVPGYDWVPRAAFMHVATRPPG